MKKLVTLALGIALTAWSGSLATSALAAPPDPEEEAKEEDPPKAPEKVDPFLDKLARFEAAYAELTCKANPDIDPTSPVATLRCPYERLEQLAPEASLTLEVYLRILKKHGFPSADDYFKAKEYIAKARPGWFEGLKNRLLEFVEECEE